MRPTFILTASCISVFFNASVLAFAPSRNHANSFTSPLTIIAASESDKESDTLVEKDDLSTQQQPVIVDEDTSVLQRFLSPKIDDPGLPLTDVLLAQIVAPSFQTFWIFAVHAPSPSWLRPLGSYFGEAPELAPRGSLLAPTLIHGAGLAVCWLAGALAAKFYEEESFTLKEVGPEGSVWDRIRSYDTVGETLCMHVFNSSPIMIDISSSNNLLFVYNPSMQCPS